MAAVATRRQAPVSAHSKLLPSRRRPIQAQATRPSSAGASKAMPRATSWAITVAKGSISSMVESQIPRMLGSTAATGPPAQLGSRARNIIAEAAPTAPAASPRARVEALFVAPTATVSPSPAVSRAATRLSPRASQTETPQRLGGVWIRKAPAVTSASESP